MTENRNKRSFISIFFRCCQVYQRIYINKDKTAYVGWCPRCCSKVEVLVGPDGVQTRFFSAQ